MEFWINFLPALNASLNAVATVFLTAGFLLIQKQKKVAHRNCMVIAFILSVFFLAGYLTHKALRGMAGDELNTTFQGEGIWAWIYYPMLISHIILAAVIVPLVLYTLFLAVRGRFETHRKWARWTFPLWYYVSVTGVLIYFFLYRWFPGPVA